MPIESARSKLRRLIPNPVDGYVLSEVLGPFLAGTLFFCFVFLMFQALRVADFFIRHGVALSTLLEIVGLMMVTFLPTAVPVAFLIGVLAGFGRLSADSELTAMKAVGFSLARLSAPVLLLAVAVGGSSYLLNSEWVPLTERAYSALMIRVANTQVIRSIQPKTFTKGFFGLLIYADSVSSAQDRLDRVFIYDERDSDYPMTVVAKRGELVPLRPNTPGGAASVMKLSKGSIHRTRSGTEKYEIVDFNQYQLFLNVEEGGKRSSLKPRQLTGDELASRLEQANPEKKKGKGLFFEWHRRLAIGLSPLLFALLGIAFGTTPARSGKSGAALTAFGVTLVYWTLQTVGLNLALGGKVPPPLAAQLPNLGLAALIAVRWRRAAW